MAFANINVSQPTDGILYANAVPLTTNEVDLYGGSGVPLPDPISVEYCQSILAIVQLSLTIQVGSNSSYIVMQTDLGDNVWVDASWLLWTAKTPQTAIFVLTNGSWGDNAFQQSRVAGTPPSFTGS